MINKKKIKIFITGHKGMVGSSLLNFLKKKHYGKLLYATRSTLNLENSVKVDNFIKKHKPDVIVNCAGKVGGILANSIYPTEFLNENILLVASTDGAVRIIHIEAGKVAGKMRSDSRVTCTIKKLCDDNIFSIIFTTLW